MGCSSSSSLPKGASDFHHKYLLAQKLGEGSFAQVYICKERSNKNVLAVKVLDASQIPAVRQDARREAQIWQQVAAHPNCVNLLHFFEDNRFCYLVMEKCNCTVLHAFLSQEETGEDDLSQCFRGMLKGLQHVHSLGVVHRDVKPDNFLLETGTQFTMDSPVKLCDFGLAASMEKGKTEVPRGCMARNSSLLTHVCGTAPYMAPEMLETGKKGYGTKVDVWAMGVSAYLMLFGDFPYKPEVVGSKQMMEVIRKGAQAPSYKARVGFEQPSELACDFVRELLDRSAKSRPDAESAQQNTFISRIVHPTSAKTVQIEAGTPDLPGSIRNNARKQSFHQTLKAAQDLANKQYKVQVGRDGDVVSFPSPDVKDSFERALMEMQREHGGSLRNSTRTMSGPSKSLSQISLSNLSEEASLGGQEFSGRSRTRHSTHSGSFCMIKTKCEESDGSDGGATKASSTADPDDKDIAQLNEPEVWKCAPEATTPGKDIAQLKEPDVWKCAFEATPETHSTGNVRAHKDRL